MSSAPWVIEGLSESMVLQWSQQTVVGPHRIAIYKSVKKHSATEQMSQTRAQLVKGLSITSASADVITVDSSGNVGINKTSPVKDLDVTGEIRCSTGILFGTDTAAANTLDDFEEGTWTPNLTSTAPGTGSFSAGLNNGGFYTKIGKRVMYQFNLAGTWTVGTAGGSAVIDGLPFTNAAATDRPGNSTYSPVVVTYNDAFDLSSGFVLIGGLIVPGTSGLRVYAESNTIMVTIPISDAATTINIHAGGSYEVA